MKKNEGPVLTAYRRLCAICFAFLCLSSLCLTLTAKADATTDTGTKVQTDTSEESTDITLKKKKQNHKYDSAMDATPAPASSITPKPFKVIPIAAKVCVNSL